MLIFFDGLVMCMSMFTIIPLPARWNEKAMSYMMVLLPLAGLVIGALWYGAAYVLDAFGAPQLLQAVLLALCPMALSGFIHIDGFMDTADSVLSCAPLEKKHAILKDSHVGAFAVIALCALLLLSVSALQGALEKGTSLMPLFLIPVLSRCVSALTLLSARPMLDEGYGASFRRGTGKLHKNVLWGIALCTIVVGGLLGGAPTLIVLCALGLGGTLAAVRCVRELNGASGDVCGCVSTISEITALVVLAIV